MLTKHDIFSTVSPKTETFAYDMTKHCEHTGGLRPETGDVNLQLADRFEKNEQGAPQLDDLFKFIIVFPIQNWPFLWV